MQRKQLERKFVELVELLQRVELFELNFLELVQFVEQQLELIKFK